VMLSASLDWAAMHYQAGACMGFSASCADLFRALVVTSRTITANARTTATPEGEAIWLLCHVCLSRCRYGGL
jgi:hypothetical protein